MSGDLVQRLGAVVGLADHFHAIDQLQFFAQHLAGDGLVVDD